MAAARHILLTGGNSGIGFEAAVILCRAGHRLTLPCLDRASAEAAGRLVLERAGTGTPPATAVCDLADLESVRACAAAQLARGTHIDSLVLNAGMQYAGASEPRRTAQGHELSFGVNHLGHFLLAHQLCPLLAAGPAPRLVVTASEVHDPTTAGGKVGAPAGLGELAGLVPGQGTTMVDGSARFSSDKAYKDSKLCNVLFAREFARRLEAGHARSGDSLEPGTGDPAHQRGRLLALQPPVERAGPAAVRPGGPHAAAPHRERRERRGAAGRPGRR